MAVERKIINFKVKAVDEEEGIIEGYGSTFSKVPDSYGDIVDEGAFTKTIQENADNIVSLFNHDVMSPIGKPELSTDQKGLLTRIKLVRGVQKAEETLLLAKAGVITQMSIGYNTVKESWVKGVRHLQEVKLYDVSPVIFAANPEAVITGVKKVVYNCECIDCGYKMESSDHCVDIKCPECGGEMRREERPGTGKSEKSGRVLSSASLGKIQAALDALQALLGTIENEPEPVKATLLAEVTEGAAELEGIVTALKAENEGFNTKAAEERIEAILEQMKIKQEVN